MTEDRLIAVPGGTVFVRVWRLADDRQDLENAVILLHDSLGSVELWRSFPELLCQKLRRPVIAYDRLGFGKSTARLELPPVDFIKQEAEIIFPALLSRLKIDQFVAFGHSVGGCMALLVASLFPDRCTHVISESAQAFVEARTRQGISKAKETFSQTEHFSRLQKYHSEKTAWVLRAWIDVWLSEEFKNWSLRPDLSGVRCPALVIHGELDEYGSESFPNLISEAVQGPVEKHILKNTGHVPHRERETEVLALIQRFLQSR
jgi:pimeloyl-ACP methyl ester carboxylesterase